MQESKKDLPTQGQQLLEDLGSPDEKITKNGGLDANADPDTDAEERPPLFKRWRGWYSFVLLVLLVLILLFYLFTKHYN